MALPAARTFLRPLMIVEMYAWGLLRLMLEAMAGINFSAGTAVMDV